MWGHDLVAGFAGLVLSFVAPLANPAFVAPAYSSSNYGYGSSGSVDCTLTVSQSGVSAGTAAQVTWTTSGASTATMSQDGSPAVSVALSGSVPVTITRNTSLSLTARNQYGAFKTCTAAITVSTNSNAPSCGLSPTPGVHYAGQQIQLVWYTQNATAAQISNVGAVPSNQLVQGSITITPTYTTLYTMTVSNPSGSRTCSALVSINQRPATNYQPVTTQQVTYRPTTSGTPSYSSPRSYPTYTYPSSSGSSYSAGRGLGYGSYGNGSSYYGFETIEYPSSRSWLTNTWNGFGDLGDSFTVQSFPHNSYGGCPAWTTTGSDANCYGATFDNPVADDYYNPGKYDYQRIFPGQSATEVINGAYDSSSQSLPLETGISGIGSNQSWSLGTDPSASYNYLPSGTGLNGVNSNDAVLNGFITSSSLQDSASWQTPSSQSIEAGNSWYDTWDPNRFGIDSSGEGGVNTTNYYPYPSYSDYNFDYAGSSVGGNGGYLYPSDGFIYNPDVMNTNIDQSNFTGGQINYYSTSDGVDSSSWFSPSGDTTGSSYTPGDYEW